MTTKTGAGTETTRTDGRVLRSHRGCNDAPRSSTRSGIGEPVSGTFWCRRLLSLSSGCEGSTQMAISGSSLLAWGCRTLSGAVEARSRLRAHLMAVAGCGGRAVEQRSPAVAGPAASSAAAQQPPTVADPETATGPQAHREPS